MSVSWYSCCKGFEAKSSRIVQVLALGPCELRDLISNWGIQYHDVHKQTWKITITSMSLSTAASWSFTLRIKTSSQRPSRSSVLPRAQSSWNALGISPSPLGFIGSCNAWKTCFPIEWVKCTTMKYVVIVSLSYIISYGLWTKARNAWGHCWTPTSYVSPTRKWPPPCRRSPRSCFERKQKAQAAQAAFGVCKTQGLTTGGWV